MMGTIKSCTLLGKRFELVRPTAMCAGGSHSHRHRVISVQAGVTGFGLLEVVVHEALHTMGSLAECEVKHLGHSIAEHLWLDGWRCVGGSNSRQNRQTLKSSIFRAMLTSWVGMFKQPWIAGFADDIARLLLRLGFRQVGEGVVEPAKPQQPSATPAEMLHGAEWAADRGWHVVPLHQWAGGCGCGYPAVHSRVEVADATTDAKRVRRWWREWPLAGVGIICGRDAGLCALAATTDAAAELLHALGAVHRSAYVPINAYRIDECHDRGALLFRYPHDGPDPIGCVQLEPGLEFVGRDGVVALPPTAFGEDSGPRRSWMFDPKHQNEFDVPTLESWAWRKVLAATTASA